MRMRTETLGGLTTHLVGGTDGAGGGDGPAVVLLHGFGAPGTDLVPLAGALRAPAGTRFVFPEAPLELPWGWDSRAWWMIDMVKLERALQTGNPRDMGEDAPEGLPDARSMIVELLGELESRFAAPAERIVLGGFSQGSMLAMDVALRHERRVAGLVLWSTTMLCEREWRPLLPGRAGMRAFQSHGTHDPLLPFSAAERLRDALKDAGWLVDFHAFRGAHEIPERALTGAADVIREALGFR